MEANIRIRGEEREVETKKRTFLVLSTLPVMLSWSVDLLGRKPRIDPPDAYQLQNAVAVYLLVNSLRRVRVYPSPSVALPPLNTVLFILLISSLRNTLREELTFCDTQRPRWYEVEGTPTMTRQERPWSSYTRKVSESYESDMLVWWPSARQIPLETGLDEGSGKFRCASSGPG